MLSEHFLLLSDLTGGGCPSAAAFAALTRSAGLLSVGLLSFPVGLLSLGLPKEKVKIFSIPLEKNPNSSNIVTTGR